MKHFDKGFIGQQGVKNVLSFLLEGYEKTGAMMPILFVAKRGAGKTDLVKKVGKHLIDRNTSIPKPFLEINGASLRNTTAFVDKAVIPFQNKNVTYFIDETHSVDSKVQEFLLSVLNINSEMKSTTSFDGQQLEFDLRKHTFMFATTDPQKLFPAFKSRCRRIDFQPYTIEDIRNVLLEHATRKGIRFENEVENRVAAVCRNTPREAVKIVEDIKQYCFIKSKTSFNLSDWDFLTQILGLKPLGLNNLEFETLKLLKTYGNMSLTSIANNLSVSRSSIMNDVEPFLVENRLIKIDSKRSITVDGVKALDNYENQRF